MYKTSLILAAGDGKRMKSDLPKVMHKVCGYELVKHVFNAVNEVSDDAPVVITGRRGELMHALFGDSARYAEQTERKGTAHAVMCGQHFLEGKEGYVTITAGDMPLITGETFKNLFDIAIKEDMSACVLTAIVEDAFGYGRIIRDEENCVAGIVEHRDATEEQKKIREINTSIYCFKISDLLDALTKVDSNNAQGELYLTDTLGILRAQGKKVGACTLDDVTEAMGINDRVQLSQAEKQLRKRINEKIMRDGITLIDPESTYIEAGVTIENDTVIYPNNLITGNTHIGKNCVLYPNNRIDNSTVKDGCVLEAATVVNACVEENSAVGPYEVIKG